MSIEELMAGSWAFEKWYTIVLPSGVYSISFIASDKNAPVEWKYNLTFRSPEEEAACLREIIEEIAATDNRLGYVVNTNFGRLYCEVMVDVLETAE